MSPLAFSLFMAFELPLFVVQITVLVVLAVQNYRRKYILSNDFCILYGLQNVAECVSYLDHFFSNRLLSSGLISPTLIPSGLRGIVFTTTLYFRYYQYASHTAISLNRYTAMAYVTNNQRMWHGRLLGATLIIVLACPIPSVILQLFNEALILQTEDGSVVVMKNKVLHMVGLNITS
ncbi:hypothetical protein AAVH_14749 [Aphelenchoides avenae]|nr:hypothetical protein AAVH_14749 [Aphelenchus avenae]